MHPVQALGDAMLHRRCGLSLIIAVASTLVGSAGWALDLTGKWYMPGVFFEPIVQVTQTGGTLSFGPLTGTVTEGSPFSTYAVTFSTPSVMVGIGGRIMPGDNLFDGRGVVFVPPSSFQVASLVATRCTCDDGNAANGDGCDARCRVELCWNCAGDPSVCTPASDGSACEDGSPCTTGETCTLGACGGSTPVSPCTDMTGLWSRHQEIPGLGQAFDLVTDFEQRGTDVIAGGYVGTIDPATGAFDLRIVNPNLFCPAFDPLVGTVAPSGLTYAATGTVAVPQPLAPDHCDGFGLTETASRCGPGGCPTTTTTTTTTSTSSTTTTTTVPGTACAAAPLAGCRLPVEPRQAKLVLKDKLLDDEGDAVTWKYAKGAATTLEDLGDPAGATNYVACLYDGAGERLMTLHAPAGGTCGALPCWKAKGSKGYRYSDKERTPDGVRRLTLASGLAGKTKIALSAKGDDLPLPTLGAFTLPLRVQLQGNGLCWEAVYGTPQENSTERFKAVAD